MSQDAASGMLRFGQSALSQYLNGRIPLNAQAAAKFAKLLNCRMQDFSPSIAQEASHIAAGVSPQPSSISMQLDTTDLDKIEEQLVLMLRELPQEAKGEVIQVVGRLYERLKPENSTENTIADATLLAPPKTKEPPVSTKKRLNHRHHTSNQPQEET
ncbi:helix-turn-helix transcriptional regulator [Diaphorobacter sp.]|uniref:helix-turn-helix domain-containing protein n=1 Tax=Diaphorobacter sp. TaxID=1934310 RepID=UPI0028ADA87E|nr:helix-turn-helix transcriptional regulator [Diaphorobacter sp.]